MNQYEFTDIQNLNGIDFKPTFIKRFLLETSKQYFSKKKLMLDKDKNTISTENKKYWKKSSGVILKLLILHT